MRVLLATDDSTEARRATTWLRDLPLPPDTAIRVVSVATLAEPPPDSRSLTELRESLRTEARQAGVRAAGLLEKRWSQVDTAVVEGDATVEILHIADEARVDMIVVGARRLGRVTRLLGGSTSLAVARYATCAAAVVQGRPRRLRTMLVAVDDSPAARAAGEFLSRFEPADDSRTTLLHVLPEPAVADVRAKAEQILAETRTALPGLRGAVETMVVAGDPAQEIVRLARESDVDLVVMGARGLRTLGRLFLGSVSEAVLHHAGRPVIIVRELPSS
jgi:nucleotide-binding universal stress UspA family protein